MTEWFVLAWPWIGLVGAAVLVGLLASPLLRVGRGRSRWRDPAWLGWLITAAYLVHQVEEYGVAADGRVHAFPADLCAQLGYGGVGATAPVCPLPPDFFLAVNIPLTWIAFPVAAALARRIPALGVALAGVLVVNAAVHVVPLIAGLGYRAGLVTALLVLLPAGVWTVAAAARDPRIRGPVAASALAAGVLVHGVLLGSILLFLHGLLAEPALLIVQILDPFLAIGVVALVARRSATVSAPSM